MHNIYMHSYTYECLYTSVYTYTQFYDFHYKEKMNCIFTSKKKRILDCIWQEMASFLRFAV